jgi:hypothetical protein
MCSGISGDLLSLSAGYMKNVLVKKKSNHNTRGTASWTG